MWMTKRKQTVIVNIYFNYATLLIFKDQYKNTQHNTSHVYKLYSCPANPIERFEKVSLLWLKQLRNLWIAIQILVHWETTIYIKTIFFSVGELAAICCITLTALWSAPVQYSFLISISILGLRFWMDPYVGQRLCIV